MLALKVSLTLDLPLLLEPVNNILVVPSDLGANPLDGAVLPSGLQSEDTESGGDDHLLDSVLGGGDTLVKLKSLEGGGTSRALVGDHTADSLVEDSGRSTEVEGTRLPGVDNVSLVEVVVVLYLVPEEGTRDVDLLTSDNGDLLASEDLLGNDRSKSTEEVTFAVNDDGLGGESGHLLFE